VVFNLAAKQVTLNNSDGDYDKKTPQKLSTSRQNMAACATFQWNFSSFQPGKHIDQSGYCMGI